MVVLLGSEDESFVFPVIEVLGAISPYAPSPYIAVELCMFLVFAVPVVGAVLLEYLESMRMDRLAVSVKPALPGADAVVALCYDTCSNCHHQEDGREDCSCSVHLKPMI